MGEIFQRETCTTACRDSSQRLQNILLLFDLTGVLTQIQTEEISGSDALIEAEANDFESKYSDRVLFHM